MTEGNVKTICWVSSCGGHLTEALVLARGLPEYRSIFVLNDQIELSDELKDRTFFISHSERDWRTIKNVFEAWRILRYERPSVVVSTGAGPAVPFGVAAKCLGIPVVFIETVTRIYQPSMSGRVMYYLADRFIYQWPFLRRYFPQATYGGNLFGV